MPLVCRFCEVCATMTLLDRDECAIMPRRSDCPLNARRGWFGVLVRWWRRKQGYE